MSPSAPASPPSSDASKPVTNEQPNSRPSTPPAEHGDPLAAFRLPGGRYLMIVPKQIEADIRRASFHVVKPSE